MTFHDQDHDHDPIHDDDINFDQETAPHIAEGHHPWAVRPRTRGRSSDLSVSEQLLLQHERVAAAAGGLTWSERGPPGPDEGGPQFWRGQKFREGVGGGKKRFANRGGKSHELC